METKIRITVNEKILLYLKDFMSYRNRLGAVPFAVTQKGIANGVGIIPSHVPRSLKKLKSDNLVMERSDRIEGVLSRRLKVYFLTDEGYRMALELQNVLQTRVVPVKSEHGIKPVPLKDVNKYLDKKLSLLELINWHQQSGVLDPKRFKQPAMVDYSTGRAPHVASFVGRETELNELKSIIASEQTSIIVIYGPAGIGKTALTAKLLESYRGKYNIFWFELHYPSRVHVLLEALAEFLAAQNRFELQKYLSSGTLNLSHAAELVCSELEPPTLLIFDGYFDVAPEIVEFCSYLVTTTRLKPGIKLLVTARENTPFYNRFYTKQHVSAGLVRELFLRGLDDEAARTLFGLPDLRDDAFRQIYGICHGNPQILLLVRDGDTEKLQKSTIFTKDEIRLLNFLKSKRSSG